MLGFSAKSKSFVTCSTAFKNLAVSPVPVPVLASMSVFVVRNVASALVRSGLALGVMRRVSSTSSVRGKYVGIVMILGVSYSTIEPDSKIVFPFVVIIFSLGLSRPVADK